MVKGEVYPIPCLYLLHTLFLSTLYLRGTTLITESHLASLLPSIIY